MDPKAIVNGGGKGEWRDNVKAPGVKDSTKENTYALYILHADGTEEWRYYRRDSAQGGPSDQLIGTDTSTVNETQRDAFKAQQPTATSQATGVEDRRLGTHPETGRPAWRIQHPDGSVTWDEANVPASATSTTAPGKKLTIENGEAVIREIGPNGEQGRIVEQRPATAAELQQAGQSAGQAQTASNKKPVPGKPGVYEVSGTTKDPQGNTIAETHYEDEAGNRVPTPGGTGVAGTNRTPVAGKPGIYQVKNATKDAEGNTSEETHFEDEQGNRVATPTDPKENERVIDGKIFIRQSDGSYKPAQVEGLGGNAPPDIGALKAELGNIVPELEDRHRRYQELVAASGGKYTQDDVAKWVDRDLKMAQAHANEITTILNGQQNIRSQDISQRGQTLQDQGNRQQLASTAATNAIKAMNDLGPALGKQPPGAVGRVIDYYKGLYTDMAKSLGVPAETPAAVPRTTAQQGLMDTVPQGITINIGSPNTAPAGGPQGLSGLQTQLSGGLANTVAGGGPGYDPMNPAGMDPAAATPVGVPGSPSQVIDQYHDPNDEAWNTALEQVKAEITTPPGGAQAVSPYQRFAGGQLRAPGAGPVGAGPVGAVG